MYDTKREEEESGYERMRRVTEDIADRALLRVGGSLLIQFIQCSVMLFDVMLFDVM